jgi:hypothetical protein
MLTGSLAELRFFTVILAKIKLWILNNAVVVILSNSLSFLTCAYLLNI